MDDITALVDISKLLMRDELFVMAVHMFNKQNKNSCLGHWNWYSNGLSVTRLRLITLKR